MTGASTFLTQYLQVSTVLKLALRRFGNEKEAGGN